MKKKPYIKPQIETVHFKAVSQLLAGSEQYKMDRIEGEKSAGLQYRGGGNGNARSRGTDDWDWED